MNAGVYYFVAAEFTLAVLVLLPPVTSMLMFAEMAPALAFDCALIARRRLRLDVIWVVRDMQSVKVQGIARVILYFVCAGTAILKLTFGK